MTTAQIFSLIAEIFTLSAKTEPKSISLLHKYITENFQGETQVGLLTILKGIEYLQAASNNQPSLPMHAEENKDPFLPTSPVDSMTREFKAMLLDGTFASSKGELVEIFRKAFGGASPLRVGNKDSKQELIERAVRSFKTMSPHERRQVFQQLRVLYLRNRQSSLEQWSEIITKGK
ncbi:hypothetical protein [Corallococcus llansteffanensis]|uniref:hypothetical protein n=1 Tax=Corallococcus llansteffanensis TaxID=2316731 RepID=UPI0011C43100|nr:hypothetical protein [Corallococcus llansteffanensis]